MGATRKALVEYHESFLPMVHPACCHNLVISLMESSSQSADGDMWKGRAIVFVEALMKVLVYMRDKGHILLDANTIRNYFDLTRLGSDCDG